MRSLLVGVVVAAGLSTAQALEMRVSGNQILLSGTIQAGDEFKFKELVDGAGGKIRIVRLNSGGGGVEAAGQIGRIIRKHGMTTIVDAAASRCGSACTIIFGAGASRHYLNATRMADGPVSPKAYRGLAFHEGSSPLSRAAHRYSGPATAAVIGWYYEFGISAARSLATQAPPNGMYQVSGATALSMGIATSLGQR